MSEVRRALLQATALYAVLWHFPLPAHAESTTAIGLAEGTPAGVRCPGNTYLAGVAVQSDKTMTGLTPYCVGMSRDGAWNGGAQIYVDRVMSPAIPGGRRLDLFCPRDFYLTGYQGASQVYGIHAIDRLVLTCLNLKTAAVLQLTGPNSDIASTEWPASQCAGNEVADAVTGRVWEGEIIQFAFSCSPTRAAAFGARLGRPDAALQAPWMDRSVPPTQDTRANVTKLPSATTALPSTPISPGSAMRMSVATQGSSSFSVNDPNACAAGYVWRLARQTDLVCVTPAARERTAHENAADPLLHDAKGSYGPNSCAVGYVWREAYRDDVVCVTPDTRAVVRQENGEALQHRRAIPAGR